MNSFKRIFDYIWPQWHRLVIITITAVLTGMLFSLSFLTIIPLLKVMMGEESIHSWADRQIVSWRYGMDFYVPDTLDAMSEEQGGRSFYYLHVTSVEDDSLAHQIGIQGLDRIVGVDDLVSTREDPVRYVRILKKIATARDSESISLEVRRPDPVGGFETLHLSLPTPTPQNHAGVKWTAIDEAKWLGVELTQWATSFIPEENTKQDRAKAVIVIILAMGIVTIARGLMRFVQGYEAEKVVQIAIGHLREDAVDSVMYMPVGFFADEGTSDTVSRIVGDTSVSAKGIKVLLGKFLRESFKALFCLIGAMLLSLHLVLIFLALAPITVGLLGLLGRKIKKATKRSLVSSARMLGKLEDAIRSLRVVKVYNRQDHESEMYHHLNLRFVRQVLKIAKVQSATGPIMEVLGMIAGSAALIVGTYWVFDDRMSASYFFALLVLLGTSAESVRKLSDVWNRIQEANAAANRVFAVIDAPRESEPAEPLDLAPLKNVIQFEHVDFSYPRSSEAVLQDINLRIPAGRNIAIVGPNGSGKTTLVNLIPRFYNPTSGRILIDGTDISEVSLKSLRRQIAMVTQNVITFNDTIANNISYGKPEAEIDEIIEVAKRAFAHEFIDKLPEGYDTMIGEHGAGLSGGQLQRIVIARAILKDPSILIFDEAMSQVDADSESKIHQALQDLVQHRTCLIIAHRFSTVISADSIVVMDSGRIVAQGTHDQLLQSSALYQSLYETQLVNPQV